MLKNARALVDPLECKLTLVPHRESPEALSKVRTIVRQLIERAFALGDLAWSHHLSPRGQGMGRGEQKSFRSCLHTLKSDPAERQWEIP